MIELSDHEIETAQRIVREGSVALGDRLPVSTAIRLGVAGLVTITPGPEQRALPTREARTLRSY